MKKLFLLTVLLTITYSSFSQTDRELALDKKKKAIELMDNGSPDESIKLLEEAKKLDPGTYIYDYEIAFAYSIKKDTKKSLEIAKELIKFKDANDQCYQMIGNLYDELGDQKRAIKAYDDGLKLFPNSGRLYLEKGNLYWIQKKYIEALPFYELGIKADPTLPSNYYRATLLYLNSKEEVWGMIYGEIFLNLEVNTKRTKEISKLLYDTYQSQIKFTSDTSFSVSFSKFATITIDKLKDPENFKLPFGVAVYEPTLMLSILGEKSIDINSLYRIRERFVSNYYDKKFNVKYPNALFDFQKTLIDSGYFQAYNYWLLSGGDTEAFDSWKGKNKELWDKFVDWFNKNGMALTQDNKFSRDQY